MQRIFPETVKQRRGEDMGSVITGLESMGNLAFPDAAVVDEQLFERGLSKSVEGLDNEFPETGASDVVGAALQLTIRSSDAAYTV
jgi:hypothetical protein